MTDLEHKHSQPDPRFSVGDYLTGRTILKVERGLTINYTRYQYRCDCGKVGWVKHYPMRERIRKGLTKCPHCMDRHPEDGGKAGEDRLDAYGRAGEILDTVNACWKPIR